MNIELKHYAGSAICRSQLYSSRESFLPITYEFTSGNAYCLYSDFGRGSWALVTHLGGRGQTTLSGNIYVNGKVISCDELQAISWFIGEYSIDNHESTKTLLTAREHINTALHISKLPYSDQDIKHLFGISDERFDRNIQYISGEIWRISTAIGFALNRSIFCYPWMNTQDLRAYFDPMCVDVLKKNEKIILLPTCRNTLKSPYKQVFEYNINFHDYKNKYFDLSSEDRRKIKKMKGW